MACRSTSAVATRRRMVSRPMSRNGCGGGSPVIRPVSDKVVVVVRAVSAQRGGVRERLAGSPCPPDALLVVEPLRRHVRHDRRLSDPMSTPTSIVVVTLRTSSGVVLWFSWGGGSKAPRKRRCRSRAREGGLV